MYGLFLLNLLTLQTFRNKNHSNRTDTSTNWLSKPQTLPLRILLVTFFGMKTWPFQRLLVTSNAWESGGEKTGLLPNCLCRPKRWPNSLPNSYGPNSTYLELLSRGHWGGCCGTLGGEKNEAGVFFLFWGENSIGWYHGKNHPKLPTKMHLEKKHIRKWLTNTQHVCDLWSCLRYLATEFGWLKTSKYPGTSSYVNHLPVVWCYIITKSTEWGIDYVLEGNITPENLVYLDLPVIFWDCWKGSWAHFAKKTLLEKKRQKSLWKFCEISKNLSKTLLQPRLRMGFFFTFTWPPFFGQKCWRKRA